MARMNPAQRRAHLEQIAEEAALVAQARFPFQVFTSKDAAARLARTCGRDDRDALYCVEKVAGGFAVASYDRKDGAPLGRI